MSKRSKFSNEDEEKIIEFVKSNEILYNVRHKKFRDTEAKNRLWLQLSKDMNVDAEIQKKKWVSMRDYFVHSTAKKTTGSAASASTSKRDESLSFLLQTSILKRVTMSSVPSTSSGPGTNSPIPDSEIGMINTQETFDSVSNPGDTQSCAGSAYSEPYSEAAFPFSPMSDTRVPKKRKTMETNEILQEFLANRPKPSDFMPTKPADDVQQFFDSMASTVRKFTPLSIAKIKLQIAQIVGSEEIKWAEQEQRVNVAQEQHVEYIIFDPPVGGQPAQPQLATQPTESQANVQLPSMEH